MRNNYIVFISSIVYALLVLIGCGDDNPVNDSREEESHDVETILIPLGESEGYFEKGICLIEWGELIEDALPFEYMHISFEKLEDEPDSRILRIETLGQKYETILDKLKEEI